MQLPVEETGNERGAATTMIEHTSPAPGHGTLGVLLAILEFPMLNAGLRSAIDAEPDMEVVGVVDDRDALPRDLEQSDADVVITESVPFSDCGRLTFETIELIRSVKPAVKILAMEWGTNGEQFSLALKAGADGFLTRDAHPGDVVNAIRCISRGQNYVSPEIVTKMVNTYLLRQHQGSMEDPYESLSDREREVLMLAATGHTNREIAKIFHLSEQTVHNYRACLMEKLGFHDRVDLLKYAIRRGIIRVADL